MFSKVTAYQLRGNGMVRSNGPLDQWSLVYVFEYAFLSLPLTLHVVVSDCLALG